NSGAQEIQHAEEVEAGSPAEHRRTARRRCQRRRDRRRLLPAGLRGEPAAAQGAEQRRAVPALARGPRRTRYGARLGEEQAAEHRAAAAAGAERADRAGGRRGVKEVIWSRGEVPVTDRDG